MLLPMNTKETSIPMNAFIPDYFLFLEEIALKNKGFFLLFTYRSEISHL